MATNARQHQMRKQKSLKNKFIQTHNWSKNKSISI